VKRRDLKLSLHLSNPVCGALVHEERSEEKVDAGFIGKGGRHLAEEYVKEGQVDQALALAAEAVKLDSQDASAHLAEGEALVAKGDLPAAVRELEAARDQAPEIVEIRWALFRAYTAMGRSEDAGKEKDAIEKLAQPGSPP